MAKRKQTKREYFAKPGAHLSDKQAAIIGKELERLERAHGELKADHVLAEAEDESSPLHEFFEWDDSAAARAYRLQQANYLVRSVEVRLIHESSGEPREVRAFVQVNSRSAGRTYMNTVDALSDEDYRAQVISKALDELRGWQKRYQSYSELGTVFEAQKAAVRQVKKGLRAARPKRKAAA